MSVNSNYEKSTYLGYTFEYEDYDRNDVADDDQLPEYEFNEKFQQLIDQQHAARVSIQNTIDVQFREHPFFARFVSIIMRCSCLHNLAEKVSRNYGYMARYIRTFKENCEDVTAKTRIIKDLRNGKVTAETAVYMKRDRAGRVEHHDFQNNRKTMRDLASGLTVNHMTRSLAMSYEQVHQQSMDNLRLKLNAGRGAMWE